MSACGRRLNEVMHSLQSGTASDGLMSENRQTMELQCLHATVVKHPALVDALLTKKKKG